MSITDVVYMQWHENGYITLVLDHESTVVSSEPVENSVNWRGYEGDDAYNCDYWNINKEELEFLNSITWE
jgi:hypothetical protein